MRGPPVCLRALTTEKRSAVETLARPHCNALHKPAAGQRRRLHRRDGIAQRRELSGAGASPDATAAGRPGEAGGRLRAARQRLRLRRLLPGDRRRLYAALPGPRPSGCAGCPAETGCALPHPRCS